MTRLRDNPIAIAEAASGAPKIVWSAIDLSTITYTSDNTLTATTAVAAPAYQFIPSGYHVGIFINNTPGLGACTIETYVSGAWVTQSIGNAAGQTIQHFATVISDGANLRIGTAAAIGSSIVFKYKSL